MIIRPVKTIGGELQLPGDKSISHRAAMLSAIATNETQISNFASSADCAATLDCLEKLGVRIERDKANIWIQGVGKNNLKKSARALDCQNSGTSVRLLSGILAGQNFATELIGDESLQKRPMRRIIEPLELMTAKIESNNDRLPLHIYGKPNLRAISYALPVASAQVKSCVLLAGLFANGQTTVISKQSAIRDLQLTTGVMRDHTERMLRWFGVEVTDDFIESEDNFIFHQTSISGDSELTSKGLLEIPSDVSSAAFFLVAAACLKNSKLRFKNVGLNPTRTKILQVLENFGAQLKIENKREINNEPIGDVEITGGLNLNQAAENKNILRGEIIAGLIDELPILSILGTQLENGLEIRDAAELRVKESDRISAIVENLRRMNARVEEFPDGLRIEKSDLNGAAINAHGDHRIAMAFAVAGLIARGETKILDSDCVKVSFPEFFEVLESIRQ